MPAIYNFELQKACDILVQELFKIQLGETVAITADTESDEDVVNATANAVFNAGGKPMVIWTAAPLGVSKAADPMLPVGSLGEALKMADAWAEFNKKWIMFSTPYFTAMQGNKKLRHMCLTGSTVSGMISLVGNVNYPVLKVFLEKMAEKIRNSKIVRMTSKTGEDLCFKNVAGRPVLVELGYADTPGTHMLAGQIAWTPEVESINGLIVLDGSISPEIGLTRNPVKIHLCAGKIKDIAGGQEAKAYEKWLKGFDHPAMLTVAHTGLGFHPGAKLSGDILQDQRVWGSTTWGFGNVSAGLLPPDGLPGPSHTDAVSLNTSIYLDDVLVMAEEKVIDEELKNIAQDLIK